MMKLRRRSGAPPPLESDFRPPSPRRRGDEGGILAAIFLSERRVWIFCLAFRAANALLVQTYFNPDEHWQALEVAHRIAFGYGHLTWEWKEGIRSYLHPFLFAVLYRFMALFRLDTPWFMMKAPRLLQSILSSFGDLYLYKLSQLIFDEQVARWALFSQLVNWFMFFCITRTLSNSLEAVLTTMALFYWLPSKGSFMRYQTVSRKLALFISALACAVRPTSAITWLYVGFFDLFVKQNRLGFLFLEVVPTGALVLALTCFLDWWMYGSWVFVPLNFLRFNFLSSGGDYYGTHKWHWYFTQGFPVMLFSFLPFSIVGMFKSKEWKLSCLVAWGLGIYSLLGHKEFRFVLPVLPVALMFSGYSLALMSKPPDLRSRRRNIYNRRPSKIQLAIFFLVVTNVPMALYMSLIHQRGSEDVMYYLSKEAQHGKVNSILFLMPCHSTPYYSALHSNLTMHFLDCSPSEAKGTLDESNRFIMDPLGFALDMYKKSSFLASHIVLFDSQESHLREFLISHSYIEVKRYFHAHFKVDRDLQASVVVYALKDP